jgi:hypothetical protein
MVFRNNFRSRESRNLGDVDRSDREKFGRLPASHSLMAVLSVRALEISHLPKSGMQAQGWQRYTPVRLRILDHSMLPAELARSISSGTVPMIVMLQCSWRKVKKKNLQVYYLDAAVKSKNPSPPATGQRGPDGTTQFGDQQPCNTRKGVTKSAPGGKYSVGGCNRRI